MVEIGLVLILYILPSLIVGLAVYFDEEIQTIGDFVKYLWAVLIPFVNIFMVGALLVNFIAEFIQKKIKLDNFWEKIKNTKIKNKISKNILPTYTLDINIESPKQETIEEVVERLYPLDNNIESPKQETLEEVVERLYPYEIGYGVYDRNCEIDFERERFIEGAKWQQERSFTLEQIDELFFNEEGGYFDDFLDYRLGLNGNQGKNKITFKEWFEQFKKK